MNPAVQELLISATEGIPQLVPLVARRFGIQLNDKVLAALPTIGAQIPEKINEFATKYRESSTLSKNHLNAVTLIRSLSPSDLSDLVTTILSDDRYKQYAKSLIEGFWTVLADRHRENQER